MQHDYFQKKDILTLPGVMCLCKSKRVGSMFNSLKVDMRNDYILKMNILGSGPIP